MQKFISCLIFLSLVSFSYANSTDNIGEQEIDKHISYVAGVIYAEAPDESFYCKSLIATTIWIRSDGSSKNFYNICVMSRQYAKPIYGYDGEKKWDECMKLAKDLYNNTFEPKTVTLGNGKIIYPDHFFSGHHPWWAHGKIWRKVGKMKFLKLGKHRRV